MDPGKQATDHTGPSPLRSISAVIQEERVLCKDMGTQERLSACADHVHKSVTSGKCRSPGQKPTEPRHRAGQTVGVPHFLQSDRVQTELTPA